MAVDDKRMCLTVRPTKEDFSLPFTQYVANVCRENPDVAMFKVVPPKGWSPRKGAFPNLKDVRINSPIKQHVFGTGGAFRCLFEEQKAVSVADFKKMAYNGAHRTPPKGHRQDELLERAFWSAVTINPPLYGADTPHSFFDERLDFGWNLRDLRDLLKQYDVPPIPGVTTPMTYFGMWKSFFSWHVEDIDLYSINYLHFGAPKVWYCVSPKDRPKFEAMARSQFPELHRVCPAFLRHKDILFSPKTLRAFHIDFVQAKQEVGEFIVLNAGAYHSGFNLGFNCAEAVNFATPDWLPQGQHATRCSCTALPDSVKLDMAMFQRGPRASKRLQAAREAAAETSSEDESESDASSSDSSTNEDEGEEGTNASSSGSEAEAEVAPKRGRGRPAGRGRGRPRGALARNKPRAQSANAKAGASRGAGALARGSSLTAARRGRKPGRKPASKVAPGRPGRPAVSASKAAAEQARRARALRRAAAAAAAEGKRVPRRMLAGSLVQPVAQVKRAPPARGAAEERPIKRARAAEVIPVAPKKRGWPKGKLRGSRKQPVAQPAAVPAPAGPPRRRGRPAKVSAPALGQVARAMALQPAAARHSLIALKSRRGGRASSAAGAVLRRAAAQRAKAGMATQRSAAVCAAEVQTRGATVGRRPGRPRKSAAPPAGPQPSGAAAQAGDGTPPLCAATAALPGGYHSVSAAPEVVVLQHTRANAAGPASGEQRSLRSRRAATMALKMQGSTHGTATVLRPQSAPRDAPQHSAVRYAGVQGALAPAGAPAAADSSHSAAASAAGASLRRMAHAASGPAAPATVRASRRKQAAPRPAAAPQSAAWLAAAPSPPHCAPWLLMPSPTAATSPLRRGTDPEASPLPALAAADDTLRPGPAARGGDGMRTKGLRTPRPRPLVLPLPEQLLARMPVTPTMFASGLGASAEAPAAVSAAAGSKRSATRSQHPSVAAAGKEEARGTVLRDGSYSSLGVKRRVAREAPDSPALKRQICAERRVSLVASQPVLPPAATACQQEHVSSAAQRMYNRFVQALVGTHLPQEKPDDVDTSGRACGYADASAGSAGLAPMAIVGEDCEKRRYFYLVQPNRRGGGSSSGRGRGGRVCVRLLREDSDGLFRPEPGADPWEEAAAALVPIRTQALPAAPGRPAGWRLLTLRQRILGAQLVG